MDDLKLIPCESLAYWLGVAQSDGCLKREKRPRGGISYYVQVNVRMKSLPMLKKFRKISNETFQRKNKIYFHRSGLNQYKIGVTTIMSKFDKLNLDFSDPPSPPIWCIKDPKLFGAYLAGVIDGDGDVRIKRPKYPQCAIRIASSKPQIDLQKSINENFNCSSNIVKRQGWKTFPDGRRYFLTTYCIEFLVSKKNYSNIQMYLIPHFAMLYKKRKIEEFLKIKRAAIGI